MNAFGSPISGISQNANSCLAACAITRRWAVEEIDCGAEFGEGLVLGVLSLLPSCSSVVAAIHASVAFLQRAHHPGAPRCPPVDLPPPARPGVLNEALKLVFHPFFVKSPVGCKLSIILIQREIARHAYREIPLGISLGGGSICWGGSVGVL